MVEHRPRKVHRSKILEHLRSTPGLQPSEIGRRFDVHPSTAEYHLRRLAGAGAVVRERVGRNLHHYPSGEGWCERARAIHSRLTEATRALLEAALDRTSVSRRLIVEQGFSRSAVRWAFQQMVELEVLERRAWGIYDLAADERACVIAALRERACAGCNEGVDQPRRAKSNPSPSGRIEAVRSG